MRLVWSGWRVCFGGLGTAVLARGGGESIVVILGVRGAVAGPPCGHVVTCGHGRTAYD